MGVLALGEITTFCSTELPEVKNHVSLILSFILQIQGSPPFSFHSGTLVRSYSPFVI